MKGVGITFSQRAKSRGLASGTAKVRVTKAIYKRVGWPAGFQWLMLLRKEKKNQRCKQTHVKRVMKARPGKLAFNLEAF